MVPDSMETNSISIARRPLSLTLSMALYGLIALNTLYPQLTVETTACPRPLFLPGLQLIRPTTWLLYSKFISVSVFPSFSNLFHSIHCQRLAVRIAVQVILTSSPSFYLFIIKKNNMSILLDMFDEYYAYRILLEQLQSAGYR